MNNTYNDIVGCRFALVSKFLQSQKTNKSELINIRKFLIKINQFDEDIRNNKPIDYEVLELIKEYAMGTKPEYRTKAK
ncbi:MAG: hypothetical protein IJ463_04415 [Bacilli bacterium]|nr:hypothetical protein [Bacilli bacterium]